MKFYSIRLHRAVLLALLGICIILAAFAAGTKARTAFLEKNSILMPAVMYHGVTLNPSAACDYIVTAERLKEDLDYIQAQGYTTVVIRDLIDFVEYGAPLPDKPILLTFDDGFYNNLSYALPLLKERNMKAVLSIVGSYTEEYTASDVVNPSYSYLRWSDINQLIADGTFELQNHSYTFHSMDTPRKASMKKAGESEDAYRQVFEEDLKKLQTAFEENTGYTPTAYTYPFGKITPSSIDYVKELGFRASLSCAEGMNVLTHDPQCLYQIKRYNRPQKTGTAEFFKKITRS